MYSSTLNCSFGWRVEGGITMTSIKENQWLTFLLLFDSSSVALSSLSTTFLDKKKSISKIINKLLTLVYSQIYINFSKPSFRNRVILASSICTTQVRNLTNNFSEKIENIKALHTLLSAGSKQTMLISMFNIQKVKRKKGLMKKLSLTDAKN